MVGEAAEHGLGHGLGPADEVGVGGRLDHTGGDQVIETLSVDAAREQRTRPRLAGEEMGDPEPLQVTVLQRLELFDEHRRGVRSVHIEQADGAERLGFEQRADDRQDGRDPTAGGDDHVTPRDIGVGVAREAPGRGHDLDLVADGHVAGQPARHGAVGYLANTDSERPTGGRGHRIAPPDLLTVRSRPERQMLAVAVAIRVGQSLGNGEGHHYGIVGVGSILGDAKAVENRGRAGHVRSA